MCVCVCGTESAPVCVFMVMREHVSQCSHMITGGFNGVWTQGSSVAQRDEGYQAQKETITVGLSLDMRFVDFKKNVEYQQTYLTFKLSSQRQLKQFTH